MADSVQWLSQSDYSICISIRVEFQPRSQGLSSYRPLERMRKDPGTRWSRVSQNLGDDN